MAGVSCISPRALVSGLCLRIEREGYVPTRADFTALMGLGFTHADLRTALAARAASRTDDTFACALAVLEEIPPAP
ncbi:Hypothetical protein A7982_06625 [Minicystis rosea]|nr:Hypothetical protein A7982_06625 [Minicystis rosea]